MSIRWRVVVLLVQLATLSIVTAIVTGTPYAAETWYGAGMLSLIINPQILEPHYHRPADVVGNSIFGLILYLTAARIKYELGWRVLGVFLAVCLLIGITALVLGANRKEGKGVGLGRAATVLSKAATSRAIFSAVFVMSLLEYREVASADFWLLITTWGIVTLIGIVNWQAFWGSLSGGPVPCSAEGMIGPSVLILSSPTLPKPGTTVKLKSDDCEAEGVILNRIHRNTDFWGQIHIDDISKCETLARKTIIILAPTNEPERPAVGVVLAASTDTQLQFLSNQDLAIGKIVSVNGSHADVLFQIRWAEIEEVKVKGGAHQVIRAHATQLGVFDRPSFRLIRHRWVPAPGGAVRIPSSMERNLPLLPANSIRLGSLLGTDIPLVLDCDVACQGHVAILGMTRMGKTTFALRLARQLANSRRVTVLDQTGEWVAKKELPVYKGQADDSLVGLSVLEPKVGSNAPNVALKYLKDWVNLAYAEYKTGTPLQRVLIIDEAHQFIPEPAALGFGNPGREAALEFGSLMMQIRKYGITIVLISQRTAVVAKSALSQCENLVAFKSVDQTGLEYLEAILGFDARKALPNLGHGEALVFGPAVSSDMPAAITVAPT